MLHVEARPGQAHSCPIRYPPTHLGEGHLVDEGAARRGEVLHLLELPALVLRQLHQRALEGGSGGVDRPTDRSIDRWDEWWPNESTLNQSISQMGGVQTKAVGQGRAGQDSPCRWWARASPP